VTASIWLPLIAGTLVFLGLLAAAFLFAGYMVWRFGRRKWRAFHSHGAVVAAAAAWEATVSGRLHPRGPVSHGSAGQWPARKVRKEMWRAVDQADAAVRAAAGVGAPTASLPALCARLRDAAIQIDQVLRVDLAALAPGPVCDQAVEIMRAAGDLQRAAVAAAGDATGHQVEDLTRDAGQEIELLDAGLASARAALPRRPR
jgi:hypothetical protein